MRTFAISAAAVLALSVWAQVGCVSRSLPALPELDLTGLAPRVSDQLEHARRQVEDAPRSAVTNAEYGLTLHAYGFLEQAAVCYLRAHRLAPDSFEYAYYLGEALAQLGQADRATLALRDALAQEPESRAARLRLAEQLAATGQAEASAEIYAALLARDPADALARYGLGQLSLSLGDHAAAIAHLRSALEHGGDIGAIHYALATAYRATGDSLRAGEHLARFERFRDRRFAATDLLRRELAQRVLSDRRAVIEAQAHLAAGELAEALAAYESALELDPDNASTHATLVGLYGAAGELASAERHYRRATKLDAELPEAHYNWGTALARGGRVQEAIEPLSRAAEIDPHDPKLTIALGLALEELGDAPSAMEQYRRALAVQPAHGHASYLLVRGLVAEKRYHEALALEEAAVPRTDVWRAHWLRELAAAHAALADLDRALVQLERAGEIARTRSDLALVAAINSDRHRYRAERHGEAE